MKQILFLLIAVFTLLISCHKSSDDIIEESIIEYNVCASKTLNIANMDLDKVPEIVFLRCKEIEEFYAGDNHIKSIPPEIGKLINLKTISFWSNDNLNTIPGEIGNLQALENLLLSYNSIDSIPIQIYQLENLRNLQIGWNKISNISDMISKLSNLEALSLWDNCLSKLPDSICTLSKLEELHLGLM